MAQEQNKLVSWSYANPYDQLLETHKNTMNFNDKMFQNATNLGELDTYFSLLELNKDTKLSDNFYNNQYYNFERNMLELYKPLADNNQENKTERFREEWDFYREKNTEVSLGEMTDREYIDYQLLQTDKIIDDQIERTLEQFRKNNMSTAKKVGHTAVATVLEYGEGALSGTAGAVDAISGLGYASVFAILAGIGDERGMNFFDAYVQYISEEGLLSKEQEYVRARLSEYERKKTFILDIDGNTTTAGKYLAGIANSLGRMGPAILINLVVPGAGMPVFYTSIFANNVYENATNPYTLNSPSLVKIGNAAINAAAEATIEWGLGQILGGTNLNSLLGLKGRVALTQTLTRTSGLKYLAKSALQEGTEEFLQDFTTNLIDKFTGIFSDGYQYTGVDFQTLMDSFFVGFASSIFQANLSVARAGVKSFITKGESDIEIKLDGKIEKIKGLRRLAFSSMMQDINDAVSEVREKGNVDLAEDVYGALVTFAQYFEGFSTERIMKVAMLLQKLSSEDAKMSRFATDNWILTDKTVKNIEKQYKKVTRKEYIREYGNHLFASLKSMTSSVKTSRKIEELKKMTLEKLEKLKNAGVTEINSVSHVDDVKEDIVSEIEEKLKSKKDTLHEKYNFLFTTDGHIAIEVDDSIFVPVAWLENYEVSEIYKFLAQEQILDTILAESELLPLLSEIYKHNVKFSGRSAFTDKNEKHDSELIDILKSIKGSIKYGNISTDKGYVAWYRQAYKTLQSDTEIKNRETLIRYAEDRINTINGKAVTQERALMDFLFNKSVYQHFLLSNKGKNSHKFEQYVFRMHEVIKGLGETANLDAERKAYLDQIYETIKDTMREPTLKAIINWNRDPKVIGADSVLTPEDREFVNQHQMRKRVISDKSPSQSAYYRVKETIVKDAKFTEEELSVIEKGEVKNATDREKFLSYALLEMADMKMKGLGIEPEAIFSDLTVGVYGFDGSKDADIQYIQDCINQLKTEIGQPLDIRGFIDNESLRRAAKKEDINMFIRRRLQEIIGDGYTVMSTPFGASNIPRIAKTISSEGILNSAFDNAKTRVDYNRILREVIIEARDKGIDMTIGDFFNHNSAALQNVKSLMADDEAFEKLMETQVVFDKDLDSLGLYTRAEDEMDSETGEMIEKTGVITLSVYSISTLVREFNHAIQDRTGIILKYTDNFYANLYFLREFPELVAYYLREVIDEDLDTTNLDFYSKLSEEELIDVYLNERGKMFTKEQHPSHTLPRIIYYIDYLLYRFDTHEIMSNFSLKTAKGIPPTFETYNGYTRTPTRETHEFQTGENTPDDGIFFDKVINNTINSYYEDYIAVMSTISEVVSDTYHSSLTKMSVLQLTNKLVNLNLPLLTRLNVSINDIIIDPSAYLSKEHLDNIRKERGEITEGTVYNYLKVYLKNEFGNISIDRSNKTHEYIFVDDNAFDDLLNKELFDLREGTESTLAEKYKNREDITLSTFYKEENLTVPGDIKVVISDDVPTQTIINKENPRGLIYINSKDLKNKDFVNDLNHEFRHLLQRYHGLEEGFTPNFEVSKELLKEVKENVPELFNDVDIHNWAKRHVKNENEIDTIITQFFIYRLIGGELEASGIFSSILNMKPFYINREAGKNYLYLGWHKSGSNYGKHEIKRLAYRKADDRSDLKIDKRKSKHIEKIELESGKYKYKYKRDTHFSRKDIDDSNRNLEYFLRDENGKRHVGKDKDKNIVGDLPPEMRKFVGGTTGKLDKIGNDELIAMIKKGTLTRTLLFNWLRTTEFGEDGVNDFTLKLINDAFFQNKDIKSTEDLKKILSYDLIYVWAGLIEFRIASGSIADINLTDKSIEANMALFKEAAKSKTPFGKQIEKRFTKFMTHETIDIDSNSDDALKIFDYMRPIVLEHYDGSMASLFYIARRLRSQYYYNYLERKKKKQNLEDTVAKGKDGDGLTLSEIIEDKDANKEFIDYDGEADIMGDAAAQSASDDLADVTSQDFTLTDYESKLSEKLNELVLIELQKTSDDEVSERRLINTIRNLLLNKKVDFEVTETMSEILDVLMSSDEASLKELYDKLFKVKDTGVTVEIARRKIVPTIKRFSTQIIKAITKGKVRFDSLSDEVKDMFVSEEVNGNMQYRFKQDLIPQGKQGAKRKDIKELLEVLETLREDVIRLKILARTERSKDEEIEKLTRKLERTNRAKETNKEKVERLKNRVKTAETKLKEVKFNVKSKNRVSDTPSEFTIHSNVSMPETVEKMYNTAFEKLANTEVQYVTPDERGKLYEKENRKDFETAQKHEVVNWTLFYEANIDILTNLSRDDIFEIKEFIEKGGAFTLAGPERKRQMFDIFILGYIISVGRLPSSWNLSESELNSFERLYESKVSVGGSIMNAANQMIKVIDPVIIAQESSMRRLEEDFDIQEHDLKAIDDAVKTLQKAKTTAEQKDAAINLSEEVSELQNKMVEKYRGKTSIWQKIKSFRFLAMLSNPFTWLRNLNSNVVVSQMNKASDAIASFIFRNKMYGEEQYDISSKTVISDEVKNFIEEKIIDNDFFDMLYDHSSKYDDRGKMKKDGTRDDVFTNLLVEALMRRHSAEHRFDTEKSREKGSKNVLTRWNDLVSFMISDAPFVKAAARKYLGRMLTTEVKNGNIDLSKGLSDDVLNLFAESVILANFDYMRKRNPLSDVFAMAKSEHPGLYEVITFWQPFLNSSFNWFTEALKFTPMGLASSILNARKFEQRIDKISKQRALGEFVPSTRTVEFLIRRDIGKGVLGTLLLGFGLLLGYFGIIKIDEEDDKLYVNVWDSVKLDISNIFGTSSILIGAALVQKWDKDDDDRSKKFDSIMALIGEITLEGFFYREVLERHKYDENAWEYVLTEADSVLRSFTPQIIQLIARSTTNRKIKYSDGVKGAIEFYLNSWIPAQPLGETKINPYTGEAETKYAMPVIGEFLRSGLLGPRIFWSEVSEQEILAKKYKVNKTQLKGKITVDRKEYSIDWVKLNKKYGELNKASLAVLEKQSHYIQLDNKSYATVKWSKLDDGQKARVIDRTMRENAEYAKIYMWTVELNGKYYTNREERETLKKLGVTKNVFLGDKGFVK